MQIKIAGVSGFCFIIFFFTLLFLLFILFSVFLNDFILFYLKRVLVTTLNLIDGNYDDFFFSFILIIKIKIKYNFAREIIIYVGQNLVYALISKLLYLL